MSTPSSADLSAGRPLVLQTEPLAAPCAAWLRERVRLVEAPPGDKTFIAQLPAAQGLVVRTYTLVDRPLLERGPNLRVVGRAGVGLDNIDLNACRERGIRVVHTPASNTQAVVEYVFLMLLHHLRPHETLRRALSPAEWQAARERNEGLRQLGDLTFGVLGLGRIGSRIAQVARAFGGEVIYHDLREIPLEDRHGAQPVDLQALVARCDVLSVHIDGRPENRGFVNADVLRGLKADAIFINAARGMVVDAAALAAALRDRPEALAIIDVHEPEPVVAANPLLALPNVTLTPHIAARTRQADENMSWVVRDVWAVLDGREPEYPAEPC